MSDTQTPANSNRPADWQPCPRCGAGHSASQDNAAREAAQKFFSPSRLHFEAGEVFVEDSGDTRRLDWLEAHPQELALMANEFCVRAANAKFLGANQEPFRATVDRVMAEGAEKEEKR